uniref:Ribonuclease H-like domain-containing protein n=1 Tax=Tanacetum cinerariifolium TaxID=118510 RepID=A0A6L2L888_TANCI|nr:ribonuclease H-like domain-containing protein [Tanacetum cinerariifolium]
MKILTPSLYDGDVVSTRCFDVVVVYGKTLTVDARSEAVVVEVGTPVASYPCLKHGNCERVCDVLLLEVDFEGVCGGKRDLSLGMSMGKKLYPYTGCERVTDKKRIASTGDRQQLHGLVLRCGLESYELVRNALFPDSSIPTRCDSTEDFYPVMKPSTIPHAFLTNQHTWHQRLGYLGSGVLRHVLSSNLISCNKEKPPVLCHACQLGKHARLLFTNTKLYFSALKRIMRNVSGTLDHGLQLFSSSTTSLVAYSDVDWAGCPTTRRSTSGYCVFLGNNLLLWSAKRQPKLSRFSAEAAYRGVANVVVETCWLRNPLLQHQCTKHIKIDIHLLEIWLLLVKEEEVVAVKVEEQVVEPNVEMIEDDVSELPKNGYVRLNVHGHNNLWESAWKLLGFMHLFKEKYKQITIEGDFSISVHASVCEFCYCLHFHRLMMVNTRTDAELSAAVQNALQTLLPQIRVEIREEFRTGSEPSNSGGNPPPVTIHTWLERFNKQKPRSFEKATAPVDAENWISHMEKIFDVMGWEFLTKVYEEYWESKMNACGRLLKDNCLTFSKAVQLTPTKDSLDCDDLASTPPMTRMTRLCPEFVQFINLRFLTLVGTKEVTGLVSQIVIVLETLFVGIKRLHGVTTAQQYDDLRVEFNTSEFNLVTYKRGLTSVEEQLVFYKTNEVIFCEQIVVLKRDLSYRDLKINGLKCELEKLKKEKESTQLKLENFDQAYKSLDKLIGSQITDKNRKGVGFKSYNSVPPPPTGLFLPLKIDLSYSGLEEFQQSEFESYGPKSCETESKNASKEIPNKLKESPDAPLVKNKVSDNKDCTVESLIVVEKKTVVPTVAKIEFVKAKQQEKLVRKPVKYAKMYRPRPVNTVRPRPVTTARPNLAVVNVVRENKTSAKVKTVNEDVRLQALVDGKKVILNEASIRCDLRLGDAEGTACLPNAAIFEELARMGKKKSRRKQRKETEVSQGKPPTEEHIRTPSHDPLPSGEDILQLNELMVICIKLTDMVLSLEQIKTNQAAKIKKLKKKVKKLEGMKKKRTHGLKRLYKVGLNARIESSKEEEGLGDQDDASKQGRITDIDADEDLSLINKIT